MGTPSLCTNVFRLLGLGLAVGIASSANAGYLFTFSDPAGLAAEAEFTLLNPTTLQIRLKNTSTGAPGGFQASDQILTGISWDFGPPGLGANCTWFAIRAKHS